MSSLNRREFLAGAGAVASSVAMGRGVGDFAGKLFFISKDPKKTAHDYVQDGLIAMWDGIENAGWGIHDPNATKWLDLIGGGLSVDSGATFEDDCILFESASSFILHSDNMYQTSEVVFRPADETQMNAFMSMRYRSAIGSMTNLVGVGLYQSVPFGKSVAGEIISTSVSYDEGSSTAKNPYVNGRSGTMTSGNWSNPVSASWRIGGACSKQFKGRVYSIRIYNRQLDNSEILANYAIDKERFGL